MDTLVGKRVTTEAGEEGTVVAVGYAEGGAAGWSLLLLRDEGQLTAGAALNARVHTLEPRVATLP